MSRTYPMKPIYPAYVSYYLVCSTAGRLEQFPRSTDTTHWHWDSWGFQGSKLSPQL